MGSIVHDSGAAIPPGAGTRRPPRRFSVDRRIPRLGRAGHGDGIITRYALWRINDQLDPVKDELEEEAVRLGWLARMPSPLINRWTGIGIAELVIGGVLVFLGYMIPMSGLTLLGFALGVGGIGTIAFGHAMSQRTDQGAYVDAMLKAYRRTLQKTLEQARNMNQVVEDPEVRTMADTPDKAVVWGVALGLHREVGEVLARELADPQLRQAAASSGAYYPYWIGSSSTSGGFDAGAGGSLFSGSGVPDFGGMMSALGSVGSTPASSSSSGGGGFGGGGGGGGGGASGGF